MIRGAAVITINCAPETVFAAVTDVARIGEFSPECTGGRWLPPATGPAVGAVFEGKNVAKLGPVPIKRWTTTSEVTAFVPGEVFEFATGDITFWRYEFIEIDGNTRVTESFRYKPFKGFQKFMYDTVYNRREKLVLGVEQTLERLKTTLEAEQHRLSAG